MPKFDVLRVGLALLILPILGVVHLATFPPVETLPPASEGFTQPRVCRPGEAQMPKRNGQRIDRFWCFRMSDGKPILLGVVRQDEDGLIQQVPADAKTQKELERFFASSVDTHRP